MSDDIIAMLRRVISVETRRRVGRLRLAVGPHARPVLTVERAPPGSVTVRASAMRRAM